MPSQGQDESRRGTRASTGDGDRRADYAAWRDRMKQKSERARTTINLDAEPEPPRSPNPNWDTDLLFQDSVRVAAEEAEDLEQFKSPDHLAVLDLRDNATDDEVAAAYRNLAKLHHPDRWIDADPETREHHELCMCNINEAYNALRSGQRA